MSQNNYGLLLVFFVLAIAGNWIMKGHHHPVEAEAIKPSEQSASPIQPAREEANARPPMPDMAGLQRMIQSLPDDADPNSFSAMMQPVDSRMTSDFGVRKDPIRMDALANHTGEDFAMPENSEVTAPADGVVEFAGERDGYGLTVEIKHSDKISSLFAHLSKIEVAAGQQIQKGQLIARSGSTGRSTGPHLHYELRVGGRPVNPKALVMLLSMLSQQQQEAGEMYGNSAGVGNLQQW